ncbi:hypothetical protein HN789_06775 [archaeon]|jgi:hypothetical protein|nr:hypothetical protein [archaeon]MBT4022731.1 hypothetical protein [archaeon]MBT4273075.1 hypothetical protein [archaeon]MBT4461056.1 hypothetical protein [archaeon]MBT4858725.1 hypothetical protein [archaeon]
MSYRLNTLDGNGAVYRLSIYSPIQARTSSWSAQSFGNSEFFKQLPGEFRDYFRQNPNLIPKTSSYANKLVDLYNKSITAIKKEINKKSTTPNLDNLVTNAMPA